MLTAALELFAAQAPGSVTMGDIAERAGVTPTAVYYHFPSKDHIVRECVRLAGERCIDALTEAVEELSPQDGVPELTLTWLSWLTDDEESALVLFVTAVGASLEVEVIRQEVRMTLLAVLVGLVGRLRPDAGAAEARVTAAGLVSWLETAARSWIERDEIYPGLGRRDFERETSALGARVLGSPVSVH